MWSDVLNLNGARFVFNCTVRRRIDRNFVKFVQSMKNTLSSLDARNMKIVVTNQIVLEMRMTNTTLEVALRWLDTICESERDETYAALKTSIEDARRCVFLLDAEHAHADALVKDFIQNWSTRIASLFRIDNNQEIKRYYREMLLSNPFISTSHRVLRSFFYSRNEPLVFLRMFGLDLLHQANQLYETKRGSTITPLKLTDCKKYQLMIYHKLIESLKVDESLVDAARFKFLITDIIITGVHEKTYKTIMSTMQMEFDAVQSEEKYRAHHEGRFVDLV
ncbi:hypothetical protein CYMTET_39593 [Cymbomonas tetramitiformis]|uniref:Uncharacterized protein n=1 Tax=Cymbomonas tetramitiformis TaxID=36881 RepID=A0AAE0F4B9_9CHLO|nr:hypothetical protein CYMTET_39593 [Cymbomonas tetramitiformis]